MRAFRYFILLFVLAVPGLAQQPPAPAEPPDSVFGEQIEVRVVNVEVVITDKQGNRVAGLAPGDLRLRVDGKEVPIEYFTEVRGGQAIAPEAAAAEGPVRGLPSLAPGSPVGTSYLVFIDDYFAIPTRRNEVLRSLKAEVARLGPEDRMAIVAFDGRKPEMLSTWSNSERTLTRALDEAMLRQAHGFQRLTELRSFETTRRLGGPMTSQRSRFAQQLDLEEISYAERIASQVSRVVSAAVGTLRGFASPPGRKVMLLLSGGWPYSPTEFVINDPARAVVSRDVPDGEELLKPLTDTANRLGYTVYPVDVPGVETAGPDASLAAPSGGGLNLREQEMHASLQAIAEETGGRALLNAGREKALLTAESDTRSYYWLGFTPTWQKNDQRHDVKVEVKRPGLEVRSRDSFLDLSRKTEVSMMVESAMLFGAGPDATPMPMQLGKPVKAGRREIEVPVTLAIPADAVTMVQLEGKHVARLELRIAAVDVEGNRSAIPVIPLQLSLDQPPPKGAHLRYDTRIKLRRINQHLIVAVFDPLSNRILTAEADITP
ncbi:MAG TPA: VWA domain-containing protein [Thermoanaerobaculia bacterium]